MKVLLTGPTGMLGEELVRRLSANHEVAALARRPPVPDGVKGDVVWIRQDLTQPLDPKTLPSRIDAVVHLAQSARYRDFPEGAEDIFKVNVQSTFQLLDYACRAGAARFVLASTGGVYAPSPDPIDEGGALATPGPYFRSKRISELLLEDYREILDAVVLRPFFIYGPGAGVKLISRLAQKVCDGQSITIHDSPGLLINPIFVTDAARAFESALEGSGLGVFNVAGTETTTITELVRMIGELAELTPNIEHAGDSPPASFVADITRMSTVLNVRPEVSLREGLGAVVGSLAATHG
jgi:UDP-glucose 4-epimerase